MHIPNLCLSYTVFFALQLIITHIHILNCSLPVKADNACLSKTEF
jgi:hypothetical protein